MTYPKPRTREEWCEVMESLTPEQIPEFFASAEFQLGPAYREVLGYLTGELSRDRQQALRTKMGLTHPIMGEGYEDDPVKLFWLGHQMGEEVTVAPWFRIAMNIPRGVVER